MTVAPMKSGPPSDSDPEGLRQYFVTKIEVINFGLKSRMSIFDFRLCEFWLCVFTEVKYADAYF